MKQLIMVKTSTIEACARAAHEANRAYCIAIGDTSQVGWAEAPEWQRTSAFNGAQGVIDGNGPRESHESWLREKEATGWKYGAAKDPEKKEHPCFVPYDELPDAQKMKDGVFVAVVKAMATALDV
ncbi:MAG TPA: RyR domain-containing protein [Gemmatimonadaceae bacterium]